MQPLDSTSLLERFARLEAYNQAFRAVQQLLLGVSSVPSGSFQLTGDVPVTVELLRLYARRRAELDVFRMAFGACSIEAVLYERFYIRSFMAGVYQELATALLDVEQGLLPPEVQARAETVLLVIEETLGKGASRSLANGDEASGREGF